MIKIILLIIAFFTHKNIFSMQSKQLPYKKLLRSKSCGEIISNTELNILSQKISQDYPGNKEIFFTKSISLFKKNIEGPDPVLQTIKRLIINIRLLKNICEKSKNCSLKDQIDLLNVFTTQYPCFSTIIQMETNEKNDISIIINTLLFYLSAKKHTKNFFHQLYENSIKEYPYKRYDNIINILLGLTKNF